MAGRFPESIYVRVGTALKDALDAAHEERLEVDEFVSPSDVIREALEGVFLSKKKAPKKKAKKKASTAKVLADHIVSDIFALWDEEMDKRAPRPDPERGRTKDRVGNILDRWAECPDLDRWRWGMRALSQSGLHLGENPQGTVYANIDYFTRPGSKQKMCPFTGWTERGAQLKAKAEATGAQGGFGEMMREVQENGTGSQP